MRYQSGGALTKVYRGFGENWPEIISEYESRGWVLVENGGPEAVHFNFYSPPVAAIHSEVLKQWGLFPMTRDLLQAYHDFFSTYHHGLIPTDEEYEAGITAGEVVDRVVARLREMAEGIGPSTAKKLIQIAEGISSFLD